MLKDKNKIMTNETEKQEIEERTRTKEEERESKRYRGPSVRGSWTDVKKKEKRANRAGPVHQSLKETFEVVRLVPLQEQIVTTICNMSCRLYHRGGVATWQVRRKRLSFQEDAKCTNELTLVARLCAQLLLQREATSPSSLNPVKNKNKQKRREEEKERRREGSTIIFCMSVLCRDARSDLHEHPLEDLLED